MATTTDGHYTLSCSVLLRAPLDSSSLLWGVLRCSELFWAALGCARLLWVAAGCCGLGLAIGAHGAINVRGILNNSQMAFLIGFYLIM